MGIFDTSTSKKDPGAKQRRENIFALEKELGVTDPDPDPFAGVVSPLFNTGVQAVENLGERAAAAVLRNSTVQKLFNVASRVNFAIAGFVEAGITTPAVAGGFNAEAAFARARDELFSGLFGIKGQKKTFADVAESVGFPEDLGTGIAKVSEIPYISMLFTDTGRGLALQRNGFFDFTPRGTAGFAADIATDPVTYLQFGVNRSAVRAGEEFLSPAGVKAVAKEFKREVNILGGDITKLDSITQEAIDITARGRIADRIKAGETHLADRGGVKMFGKTIIPGEVFNRPARNARDGVVKYLEGTSLGRKSVDIARDARKLFDRDAPLRKLGKAEQEVAIRKKEDYFARKMFAKRAIRDQIEELGHDVSFAEAKLLTEYLDTGGKIKATARNKMAKWAKRSKNAVVEGDDVILSPFLVSIANRGALMQNMWARIEMEAGLLHELRLNYVFHSYRERPAVVKRVFDNPKMRERLSASLRGSQKERSIEVLEAAREAGLTPVDDFFELLMRRGERHVDGVETFRYLDDIKETFGQLPDELETAGSKLLDEMPKVIELSDADEAALKTLRKKGPDIAEIRKLSEDAQREFLRRRFNRIQSPIELARTMDKYQEFNALFPDIVNRSRQRASRTIYNERIVDGAESGIPQLRDVYLPEPIVQDLAEFNRSFVEIRDAFDNRAVSAAMRGYSKLTDIWKLSVTRIFPAFNFRNGYSNLMQAFTDGMISALHPAGHADALRMMAGDTKGFLTTRIGRRFNYGELMEAFQRKGVIVDYRSIYETVGGAHIPIRRGAIKFVNHPIATGMKRAGFAVDEGLIENEFRLMLATNYVRRGLSIDDAVARVKRVAFDYSNISRFERDVLKKIIPFYVWSRKNIPFQVENMLKNPGRFSIQAKASNQNKADPQNLPFYMRGRMAFQVETNEKGHITTLTGVDFPVSDLNLLSTNVYDDMVNMAGPFPKLIMELATGQSMLTGKKIKAPEKLRGLGPHLEAAINSLPKDTGKKLAEWLDFRKRQNTRTGETEYYVNGSLAYIFLKSWAISRLYSTADRFFRAINEGDPERGFLDAATGLRLDDVELVSRPQSLEREYEQILKERALNKGLIREFSVTSRPGGPAKKKGRGLFN